MADVTITSDVASLFSHDVYFEITLQDSAVASYSVDFLDMGKIKYEFEVPSSGTDVTAVGIRGGSLDVTFDNVTDSLGSFIQIINSAYSHDDTVIWSAKMFYRLKGGSYGSPIPFSFDVKDIEHDSVNQEVKISFRPYSGDFDTQIDTFFDTVYASVDQYDISGLSGSAERGIISGQFIENAIHYIYTINPSFPVDSSPVVSTDVFESSNVSSGNEWFISDWVIDADYPAVGDVLGIMGAIEGSVFGTALGTPFYFSRAYDNVSIQQTIDTDDILELDVKLFTDAQYRSVILEFWDVSVTRLANNLTAEKNLNINFDSNNILYCTVNSASTATNTNRPDPSDFVNQGGENYVASLGLGNSLEVSVKFWGIGSIYPYSIIQFDADADTIYQSKSFRVRNAEYDFKNDIVSLDLYEI